MKTENHISILRGLLPDNYTADDNGRIYSDGQPLDIRYTPEHFFEVNVANPEELIAIAKEKGDKVNNLIPLPQAVSIPENLPLYTTLGEALRFRDNIDFLQGFDPKFTLWPKEQLSAFKKQDSEQNFAQRIFGNFIVENKISNHLKDFLPTLKKCLNKIDNDKMLDFVAEQMEKIKLAGDEQQQMVATGVAEIHKRVADIKKQKTLCGRLRRKFNEAYFDKPEYHAQPLIEHLYGMCGDCDGKYPIMKGVYRDPEGWFVATDAHIIAAVAADRINSNQESGTVVTQDGKKLNGTFPNWQPVIASQDLHEFALNAADFWQWLILRPRQAKLKNCKCRTAELISFKFDHTRQHGFTPEAVFNLERLLRFVSAAIDLGNGKFYYRENKRLANRWEDETMTKVIYYYDMLVYKTDDKVPSYIQLMALPDSYYQIDPDFGVYYGNRFDATEAAPLADDDKAKRLRLAKAKAKAALAVLELMRMN